MSTADSTSARFSAGSRRFLYRGRTLFARSHGLTLDDLAGKQIIRQVRLLGQSRFPQPLHIGRILFAAMIDRRQHPQCGLY